jgi:hypothetical protein
MKLKYFFFRWWPFIAGLFLFLLFVCELRGQEKPKFTDKIDYAHIDNIHLPSVKFVNDEGSLAFQCQIFVVHDDASVFQYHQEYKVDMNDDNDVIVIFNKASNTCRDQFIDILMGARHYERGKSQNTVSAKRVR